MSGGQSESHGDGAGRPTPRLPSSDRFATTFSQGRRPQISDEVQLTSATGLAVARYPRKPISRANSCSLLPGSCSSTPRFADRFEMNGNRCPGSTASGQSIRHPRGVDMNAAHERRAPPLVVHSSRKTRRCPVTKVSTLHPSAVLRTVTAPCGNLGRKSAPTARYGPSTGLAERGGPWQEIATRGFAQVARSSVLAMRLPWCGAMSTSTGHGGKLSTRARPGPSRSPVSRIVCPPCRNSKTRLRAFSFPSGLAGRPVVRPAPRNSVCGSAAVGEYD